MSEPPPLPGWGPKKPPPQGDPEPAPKPRRFWWRFLLASLLIVAVTAGATATSVLLFIGSIANALDPNHKVHRELESELAAVHGGGPETILIIGSDKRAGPEFAEDPGRSDTTILLRLDPAKELISLLSIPRDLKVEIPGYGIGKFNSAYSYGGPKLTLKVVKELTGLTVNHVVNVDFLGFVRAVDAIGCVYTDVDRRYYHSNVGVPPAEQYSEINIQPGYQKLCGKKALEYVRYRHTDTDIVRSARQQAFIAQARKQVPLTDLLTGQSELAQIFTDYTTSDIGDTDTLIRLIDLAIESRNSEIRQIHFPAILGPSYVYASPGPIHEAVEEFLGNAGPGSEEAEAHHRGGHGRSGHHGGKRRHKKKKPKVEVAKPGNDGLVPARESGEAAAAKVARKVGGAFPVFYPTRLPAEAFYVETDPYEHVQNPRVYHLKDEGEERHDAYRMVIQLNEGDGPHYFGVQGIHGWSDPPILSNPSITDTIHGREYEIFVDNGQIKLIAWHRGEDSYWISSDLQQSLTNQQMVGMARSADVMMSKRKSTKRGAKG